MKTKAIILILLLISTIPLSLSWAQKPCCQQDNITGNIVFPKNQASDSNDSDSGGFGAPTGIALSLLGNNEKALRIGQTVENNNNKIAVSIVENIKNQNHVLQDLLVGAGMASQKMKNQKDFGEKAKAYNLNEHFAENYLIGKHAFGEFSNKARDDYKRYLRRFNTLAEQKKFLSNLEYEGISDLLLKDVLNNSELEKIKNVSKVLIAPQPPLNIKRAKNKKTEYSAIRNVYDSRKMLTVATLSDYVASKAKVMPMGDWKQSVGQKIGIDLQNTNISKNEFYSLLSDMRFANPNWKSGKDGIHDKTQAGVARELLDTKINKLKMDFEKLLLLNKITALYAQKITGNTQRNFSKLLSTVQ